MQILGLSSCSHASHSYADDVQSYKHCLVYQAASAIRTMSQARDELNAQVSSDRQQLKPRKTQHICLGTRQQLDKLDFDSLSSEFSTIVFSTSVLGLGLIMD